MIGKLHEERNFWRSMINEMRFRIFGNETGKNYDQVIFNIIDSNFIFGAYSINILYLQR